MATYITVSGQTWDQISFEVFGSEHYCGLLMDVNRDKLEYFVFPAGIVLNLPNETSIISAKPISSDYPAWRAMLNG